MNRRHGVWIPAILWVALLLLAGCSPPKVLHRPRTVAEDRLDKIGKAYIKACYRLQRGPSSFDELKPDLDPADNPDELFRSPNDGQPFVILWGPIYHMLPPGPTDPFTVAGYEKVGVDGKRYVLRYPLGVVRLSEEEFRKATFPAGHSPPKGP